MKSFLKTFESFVVNPDGKLEDISFHGDLGKPRQFDLIIIYDSSYVDIDEFTDRAEYLLHHVFDDLRYAELINKNQNNNFSGKPEWEYEDEQVKIRFSATASDEDISSIIKLLEDYAEYNETPISVEINEVHEI